MMLEDDGHTVRTAPSGAAAIALMDARLPDLLVTDVMMHPMDGVELAERARAEHPHLPVLFVSAWAPAALHPLPARSDFLSKPFDHAELLAKARALVFARAAATG